MPPSSAYEALYERILRKVDSQAYLPWFDQVEPVQRAAASELDKMLQTPGFEPQAARALARRLHDEGRIDKVVLHSTLHVIAASPHIRDYEEAHRQVAAQELAALQLGGPRKAANLASVDRHRGVLAFLMAEYEVALEYFSRAFERQRSAGNLSNVLAVLLRLGDIDEARDLFRQVRATLPARLVSDLERIVSLDPDLALLRAELAQ
jgi:tetratricopeptide (TPR) repeat protein